MPTSQATAVSGDWQLVGDGSAASGVRDRISATALPAATQSHTMDSGWPSITADM